MLDNIAVKNLDFHKRSERITAAIFLVSEYISESELIRTKIRTLSLDIVSLAVSVTDNTNSERFSSVGVLEKKINELSSFLEIASISGLISIMNSRIINSELSKFQISIAELLKTFSISNGKLSQDFFGQLDKSIEDNIKVINNHAIPVYSNGSVLKIENGDKPGRKDQRSKCILDLIAKKGTVGIKDIAVSIKGCSEKTVQRELSSLIKNGLIDKRGERRWSRYSLRSG